MNVGIFSKGHAGTSAARIGGQALRFLWLGLVAARQRAQLRQLDDCRLRDLGLTRDAAAAEADRPFWDVPQHWLQK